MSLRADLALQSRQRPAVAAPAEEPKPMKLTARVPPALHRRARMHAMKKGVTLQELLITLLERELDD